MARAVSGFAELSRNRAPGDVNQPGGRRRQSHDRAQQGGLAAAVGAYEGGGAARARQVDAPEGRVTPQTHVQVNGSQFRGTRAKRTRCRIGSVIKGGVGVGGAGVRHGESHLRADLNGSARP